MGNLFSLSSHCLLQMLALTYILWLSDYSVFHVTENTHTIRMRYPSGNARYSACFECWPTSWMNNSLLMLIIVSLQWKICVAYTALIY